MLKTSSLEKAKAGYKICAKWDSMIIIVITFAVSFAVGFVFGLVVLSDKFEE